MCAPLSLVHLASLWLVVGGIRLLLAVAQVADDYNSAEHGNGDTVAEILADANGDVHWYLPSEYHTTITPRNRAKSRNDLYHLKGRASMLGAALPALRNAKRKGRGFRPSPTFQQSKDH